MLKVLLGFKTVEEMKYTPRNKTADEILKSLGFKSVNRGYEKVVSKKGNLQQSKGLSGYNRLHALTRLGEIDLHYDKVRDEKHISQKEHPFVKLYINKIKELDMTWYQRLWRVFIKILTL